MPHSQLRNRILSKKPQNNAKRPDLLDLDHTWKYLQHADTLQYARQNFSLVAQSMLVVAFFTIPHEGYAAQTFRMAIASLGVIYTLGWFYMSKRLAARMQPLNERLMTGDPTYKIYMEAVHRHPSGKFLYLYGYFLPQPCVSGSY